jgi:hypothetical protein
MEISIEKPCHENWDHMTPNEQGAFCGKCVKTVIDFSSKSIEDIKDFFAVKQDEKVCGRFEKTQLASLSFDVFFSEFKGFNFTKRFAVIVYFTFGMWLFNTSSAISQTTEHLKGDVQIDHSTMGGVRAYQFPKDTVKSCVKPQPSKTIKGKIKHVESDVNKQQIKMGEVSAVPIPTAPIVKRKK